MIYYLFGVAIGVAIILPSLGWEIAVVSGVVMLLAAFPLRRYMS